jgi:hypothetical protein
MTTPRVRFPIGISDFRKLREEGYHYVDKTAFVDAVVGEDSEVILLPRPRRFGKTLNLSMLRCFLEKSPEDRGPLFAGLAVASSERARPHFQRYPVLFLTFKDVKSRTWDDCLAQMANVLSRVYAEHRYLLTEGNLQAEEARIFAAILDRRAAKSELVIALELLSRLLAEHHRERVVILLDEYDTPIHAGYANRYYDEVVAFFRDFLSGGFKDNAHLFKGVLTGILRVAKESLFSGLNNISVYGILRSEYAPYFGFTEPEVRALVEAVSRLELLDDLRAFYNGYVFGGVAIYNPWSVLCFLSSADKELLPYWVDTSSNDLVRELLVTGPAGVRGELEALLAGGTIDKRIEENIVLRDVSADLGAVWSFLLFTGYLKPVELRLLEGERWARLAVPNAEVTSALRKMTRTWIETQVGGSEALAALLAALLSGDGPVVERHLAHMLKVNLSYFDTAAPEPERFYHGLVVGLLAGLGTRYEVRSNRESGFGRCDVMVLPRVAGQPGVVMELKRVATEAGETTEKALTAALRQLRERDYAAELRERGAAPIHQMAVAFEGKRVVVRVAGVTTAPKAKAKVNAKAKRAAPARRGR